MSLAARFKARRIELGMTQTEVANVAGVSQQSIESIESGRTRKPRNVLELAKALKCSPDWLLNGKNIMPLAEVSTRRIPILSYVQAGQCTEARDYTNMEGEFEYVLADADVPETCFALRIDGDSMQPEFKEGDIVIIDPDLYPAPGEFVVAKNNGHEATFKKYRPLGIGVEDFELVPLNPDYPVLRSAELPLRVIGVMIEHRIYRRKR
ncbi:TPA: S24 family peptidase [Klebsiella pneumoniae]|uniref:LexA family protein n=1 Tax=Klebsiella pneumoniae TaxID=573 RepID=UPI000E2A7010|nr:S24 family peptidase [Klebsiella pneumoniae]EKD1774709.1 helix-turn-helix domain-containing protein [Escherichia coli]ELA3045743.1 helix-turn-helix domain-containing protein [Klebsiella pneumoniae]SYT60935.1 phage repressor [Klebsiella pneumoniae]